MKLFYCIECSDMVCMIPEKWRTCQCGQARGRYIKSKEKVDAPRHLKTVHAGYRLVEVEGPLMVFGIENKDLRDQDRLLPRTYRIPPSDLWIKWTDLPETEKIRRQRDYKKDELRLTRPVEIRRLAEIYLRDFSTDEIIDALDDDLEDDAKEDA